MYKYKIKIGDFEANAIAEILKNNPTITSLDFSDNEIGQAGAIAIARMLKDNTTITLFNFSNNSIGLGGAIEIVGMLKVNSTITSIDLSDNEIGVAGAKELVLMLKDKSTITSISLKYNGIGEAGVIAIAEMLKDNPTITTLDLSYNKIGNEELKTINTKTEYNKLIKNLAKLIKKYFVDEINLDNAFKIACIGKHYKKVSKELLKEHLQEQNVDDPRVVIDEIDKLMKECLFSAPRICRQIQPKEFIEGELHISNLPIESINHITSYLEHTPWGWEVEGKDNNSELDLAGLTGLANNQTPPAG